MPNRELLSRSQSERANIIYSELDRTFIDHDPDHRTALAQVMTSPIPAEFYHTENHILAQYKSLGDTTKWPIEEMRCTVHACAEAGDVVARAILDYAGAIDSRPYMADPSDSVEEAIIFAEKFLNPEKDLPPIELREIDDTITLIEGALATARMIKSDPQEEYEAIPMTHEMWQSVHDPFETNLI